MKAVILAAGQGIRIRDHHKLPKGFIEIDHKPLIKHSLEKLRALGIQEILLVTGFLQTHYTSLAKSTGWFDTLFNTHFADYGSLYSLYCAKSWVDSDFLLLESDILYDANALTEIHQCPKPNVILTSGTTHSGDEVYVCAKDCYLTAMSKELQTLNQQDIIGEFVGINKLSLKSFKQLISLLEEDVRLLHSGNYEEDGLVRLAQHEPIYCLNHQKLKWCEVDNLAHLRRAELLYPQMKHC